MKQKVLMALFLIMSLFSFSQKITNFQIVVTGDSHTVDGPPGGNDSIWVNKIKKFYEQYFDTVTLVNLGIGGTTTTSLMPDWYGGTNILCNIDRVLSYPSHLIILSSSGNTTVVQQKPADSSIKHFKYLVDTLRSLKKAFILTGQDARQKTFVAPITAQTYHDTSTRINNWMKSYCPKNYVDVYTRDYDNVVGLRPWPYVLRGDSLHKSDLGHRLYYQSHIENWIIDSTLSDFKAQMINLSVLKSGSNVKIAGKIRYKTLEIWGSNNYSSFVLLNSRNAADEREYEIVNTLVPHLGYKYIKVIAIGRRTTKTFTKKIQN
jgi:hypothetical protein